MFLPATSDYIPRANLANASMAKALDTSFLQLSAFSYAVCLCLSCNCCGVLTTVVLLPALYLLYFPPYIIF